MPNADFWARVRQDREAQPPTAARDRVLWRLSKAGKIAEARLREVPGRGVELRFVWQDELRASQIYDDGAAMATAAAAKRDDLLEAGWADAPELLWGR